MNVALETERGEVDIYMWVFYILPLCKTLNVYLQEVFQTGGQ